MADKKSYTPTETYYEIEGLKKEIEFLKTQIQDLKSVEPVDKKKEFMEFMAMMQGFMPNK